MKKLIAIFLTGLLFSCSQQTPVKPATTANADSLSVQLQDMKEKYHPGLGEIMGGIQTLHAKLWFAGINANWKLADYEIKEIKERLGDAVEIETNRAEVKNIPMMYPSIDGIANAIKKQDTQAFKESFQLMTNTCNSCHSAVNFEFNVITIPTALPVSNQEFKVK
jgi:cytochrome c1